MNVNGIVVVSRPQNGGMDCKGELIGQWRICNPQVRGQLFV